MTDSKKIWKGVGITAGILAGIWVIVSLFKGQWNPMDWFASTDNTSTPPVDGAPCTATTTGVGGASIPTSGAYKDGVCVATAGNAGNGGSGSGSGGSGGTENITRTGCTPTVLVPYSPDCRARYTAQHPYNNGACNYVFDASVQQPVIQQGVQYCQLKKI